MASFQFKEDKLSILLQADYNINFNFKRINQYAIDVKPLYVIKIECHTDRINYDHKKENYYIEKSNLYFSIHFLDSKDH